MALHLNLLHEQQTEKIQRERDPLKIGLLALVLVVILLAGFYFFRKESVNKTVARSKALDTEWKTLSVQAEAAKKREVELNSLINTTKILEEKIENRFLWGPVLQQLHATIPDNIQITSFEGSMSRDTGKAVALLDGIAAGTEPRIVADELRSNLSASFSKVFDAVTAKLNSIEVQEGVATLNGTTWPIARFEIQLELKAKITEEAKNEQAK